MKQERLPLQITHFRIFNWTRCAKRLPTVIQNGQYSGYYMVECSIANTVLTDKDGNSGSVVIGMQAEAKIVTQEKTIIRYLLEKINLF